MVRGLQKQCSQVSDMQIQKYKYTNTVQVKYADGPYMCYIFLKHRVQGYQKWHFRLDDKENQNHQNH